MSVFSDRLKQLRLDKGENQSDIAAFLGVSVQSYSAYEGSREPKYDLLCKIAEHYSVTTDYLLGVSDAKKPDAADVMEVTGLSEKAVETLKGIADQKNNSITLTVNTLLENRYVLGAISRYLYYEIDKEQLDRLNHDKQIIPFCVKYKYLSRRAAAAVWGDDPKPPVDAAMNLEALTNENYKKILLLHVQEDLEKLLKQEIEKDHPEE